MLQLLCAFLLVAPVVPPCAVGDDLEFTPAHAEHLFNRAGFGVTQAEAQRLAAAGLEAALEELLRERPVEPPFHLQSFGVTYAILRDRLGVSASSPEGHDRVLRSTRLEERGRDRAQLTNYTHWWIEQMAAHADPLRDRMTLFWHGHFTSSQEDVSNSYEMCRQHQLLRSEALGSFREMLSGIARDPAMLKYLDNARSTRRKPNENFARELLELFTLGEGNYTEQDVKEAARAFAGWTDERSEFYLDEEKVDPGEKTFLGRTGEWGGQDVLGILLEQPACAEYVAGSIIGWLEGVPPSPERRTHYGRLFLESDYQLRPLLGELFRDPSFYREEVVGQRIAGPLELMVGQVRRLGVEPPSRLLSFGSELLGQHLFFTPSVKGWDEGRAWITTSTLMQRGNLAGVLTGQLNADVLREEFEDSEAAEEVEEAAMMGMEGELEPMFERRDSFYEELKDLSKFGWQPRLNLTAWMDRAGVESVRNVVQALAEELLAVRPSQATLEELGRWWQDESSQISRPDELENALRGLAYLILALPEAQLH